MPQKLENFPDAEVDSILQCFFTEVRKKDRGEYEPRTMLASLDRRLGKNLGGILKYWVVEIKVLMARPLNYVKMAWENG